MGAGDRGEKAMRGTIMTGALVLALGACGQSAPKAADNVAAAPAQRSLASPDGRSEVRSDADFSGLPEGIPPYPRVRGGGAIQMGGASEEGEMRIMAFRTMDPPAAVIAFYADAGARAGFRAVHRADAGPSTALALARDNGEAMNVTATGTPTGTSVQIMTGQERPRRR
jgi:hypothetical protein